MSWCSSSRPALFGNLRNHVLHEDKDQYKSADDDARPPRIDVPLEHDQHLNQTKNQHAKERTDHVADAARQQRAANDRRCDRVHLQTNATQWIAGF